MEFSRRMNTKYLAVIAAVLTASLLTASVASITQPVRAPIVPDPCDGLPAAVAAAGCNPGWPELVKSKTVNPACLLGVVVRC
jgi:hypothetical protein